MMELLDRYARDPLLDRFRLWDLLIFNYLIGNTDGHIKNVSLLYDPALKTVSLAPAYDLISTAVYPESSRSMAVCIGGEQELDRITREHFAIAANEIGIGRTAALNRFDEMAAAFPEALLAAAEEVSSAGFHSARDLSQRILQQGGIARL